MEVMRKFKKSLEIRATVLRDTMEGYIRKGRKEMRRFMEKLERGETELRETMEETGPLGKETQVEGGRHALEEDLYDIKFLKQLERSPTRSTSSEKENIHIRPMQQNDTHQSPDSTDLSVRGRGSRHVHSHAEASSIMAIERGADGRRRFFSDETSKMQVCIRQDSESEPTPVSVRKERNDTEKKLNISFCDLHGTTSMLDRGQKPDTDVLLNKHEETPRSDRPQVVDIHTGFNCTDPSAFLFKKPAEMQRSEIIRKPGTAAMSPTTPCDSLLIKPAEMQRSDTGKKPDADQQLLSLSSAHRETDKRERIPRRDSVLDDKCNCSPVNLSLFAGTGTTAALALSFLMFATMLCPAAGSQCVGKKEVVAMAVQKGQVGLVCPVATDVHQTGQSVNIIYVNFTTTHEVLRCEWSTHLQDFDCQKSEFGAVLIEIQPDRVLATLPENSLKQDGYYSCRLSPFHPEHPPLDCNICYPADPTTTTVSAVTMSATGDLREPDDPQNKADAPSAGHGRLVTAVVILSIIVFLLLLILGGIYIRLRMRRGRNRPGERDGENNALNERGFL